MKRLRLAGTGFRGVNNYYEPFTTGIYAFSSIVPEPIGWPENKGTGKTDTRTVSFNGRVEFDGRQENSVIFRGGIVGHPKHGRRRKLVEDVLLLASLLTGHNWCLYTRRQYCDYPVINAFHLNRVVPATGGAKVGAVIDNAMVLIRSNAWQTQFAGGFHLVMLLNHANILVTETRYLGLMVIWEWLYAHLQNPKGATVHDESKNLNQVIASVLRANWPTQTNYGLLHNRCVLSTLRNQLAHSGSLPIDRKGADVWMKSLHSDFDDSSGKGIGVIHYIHFFEQLTQVVVLRTLGIDAASDIEAYSFSANLKAFLSSGRIAHIC